MELLKTNIEWVAFTAVLLVILVVSFQSRARVFCQYLRLMTGIKVTPREVQRLYRSKGRSGVRDLFIDLIIHEDLRETPALTPPDPTDEPADEEPVPTP